MSKHESLNAALAAFQADMPTVHKAETAEVTTKSGGSYTYTYANLASIQKVAMPLLASHGLAFICEPVIDDSGRVKLTAKVIHETGGSVEGELPLWGNNPQELGSSITYMRRYLLGCLTGIVTDDDDDGAQAKAAVPTRAPRQNKTPNPTPEQVLASTDLDQLRAWWMAGDAEMRELIDTRVLVLKETEGQVSES